MASVVDIVNLSLGHLGDEAGVAAISPPDGSVQAAHAARFYPIARDVLLQQHAWGFATARQALAELSTTELPAEWAYVYSHPNCLEVFAVFPPEVLVGSGQGAIFNREEFIQRAQAFPFVVESLENGSLAIYSNVAEASALFIRQVTDTTKFTPLFTAALARLLAAYMAGPILKGEVGIKVAAKHFEWFEKIDLPRAKSADGRAGKNTSYNDFVPGSIQARQ